MSIAITEDHRSLAETVRSFAEKRDLRGAARAHLESPDESLRELWSEIGHEAAAIMTELNGPDSPFIDGPGAISNLLVLMHRGMSIAAGTSEIKRNRIGGRILGLPRDPLLK